MAVHRIDTTGGKGDGEVDAQIQQLCAAERAAVCDLTNPPAFRMALIRIAPDRHRVVLTNHHIVLDGWSTSILLQEIFAAYYGQRLPAATSYRRFVTWLADRDLEAAHTAWRELLAGFDSPTLVGPRIGLRSGSEAWPRIRSLTQTTRALTDLARSHHTTVNTVLQAGWARLLMWLTGQRDVAFGAAVSGRPTELPGAESMVGLLINTVPVRANITAATTTRDLLNQLRHAHSHTLDHQHLALSAIHRVTGHDQLFDTLLVYENYPVDTTAFVGCPRVRRHRHSDPRIHPLPADIGSPLGPATRPSRRIRHRHLRRRPASRHSSQRLQRVLVAMTADPDTARCRRWMYSMTGEHARLDEWGNRAALNRAGDAGIDSGVVRRTGQPLPRGRGVDLRWPLDDLSRAR